MVPVTLVCRGCGMKKVLWVKFGWSEFYRGDPVDGNFGWLNEHRGTADEGRGHEAFNFLPEADGSYRCYVPPQAEDHAPNNADKTGWTVICLSKNPDHRGIHIVGWYENATLIGDWLPRPSTGMQVGAQASATIFNTSYCIESSSAYFVPPEQRTQPFSDTSVRRGKYSFLAGPDVETGTNKRRVLSLLEKQIDALRGRAIHNPDAKKAPDPALDRADPLTGFGTPEHRKAVEEAAERAIIAYYGGKGFTETRVTHLNRGYDFIFAKGRKALHVEVKGTAMPDERFFMTPNENDYRINAEWRLAIVTGALTSKPEVTVYDQKAFKKTFELKPMVYIGKRIFEPKRD